MHTVHCSLEVIAFITLVLHISGKLPALWVPVFFMSVAELLACLPLK